jgi:hypothetical protein
MDAGGISACHTTRRPTGVYREETTMNRFTAQAFVIEKPFTKPYVICGFGDSAEEATKDILIRTKGFHHVGEPILIKDHHEKQKPPFTTLSGNSCVD